jgi:hypothetical protein
LPEPFGPVPAIELHQLHRRRLRLHCLVDGV